MKKLPKNIRAIVNQIARCGRPQTFTELLQGPGRSVSSIRHALARGLIYKLLRAPHFTNHSEPTYTLTKLGRESVSPRVGKHKD